ncbi:hypothetical protein AB1N83_012471 [Pleurotus pulmonarius]
MLLLYTRHRPWIPLSLFNVDVRTSIHHASNFTFDTKVPFFSVVLCLSLLSFVRRPAEDRESHHVLCLFMPIRAFHLDDLRLHAFRDAAGLTYTTKAPRLASCYHTYHLDPFPSHGTTLATYLASTLDPIAPSAPSTSIPPSLPSNSPQRSLCHSPSEQILPRRAPRCMELPAPGALDSQQIQCNWRAEAVEAHPARVMIRSHTHTIDGGTASERGCQTCIPRSQEPWLFPCGRLSGVSDEPVKYIGWREGSAGVRGRGRLSLVAHCM